MRLQAQHVGGISTINLDTQTKLAAAGRATTSPNINNPFMNSTCIQYGGSRPEYMHIQVSGNIHKIRYTMGKLQSVHIHLTNPTKIKS